MGNFIQLLIGTTLVLVFVSLINVHSSPIEQIAAVDTSNVESVAENKIKKCYNDSDCGHGKCQNGTDCICDRGWTTYGNISGKTENCKYNQRSKKTAFFLSFFVGIFGTDWFYLSRSNLGYIIVGILKLLLGFGCFGSWPLTYFGSEVQNAESVKAKLRGISTCFSLLAFAWWIVDWARILGNRFPDGNAAELIPW